MFTDRLSDGDTSVPAFSIRDLLGTAKRREIRRSKSEEEKRRPGGK